MAPVNKTKKIRSSNNCTPNVNMKQKYIDAFDDVEFKPGTVDTVTADLVFDGLDEGTLCELNNLKPQKIVTLLIERAGNDTPPVKFLEEMEDLIHLGEVWKSYHEHLHCDEDTARFEKLVKKYGINLEPTTSGIYLYPPTIQAPDVITFKRLIFTFPHYYFSFHSQYMSRAHVMGLGKDLVRLPFLLEYPQFSGLIPSRNSKVLTLNVKKAIITLHVFCLVENSRREAYNSKFVPLQAQLVLLKKRIELSALSETRKVLALQRFNVINRDGSLTLETERAYSIVSKYPYGKEVERSDFFF